MNKNNFFVKKRRWSYYKDMLLKEYLPIYFSKILKTNKNTVYIDGFAGKGKFDDGEDGSPIIVSNIIEDALSKTKSNAKITSYFIEYEYVKELKKNLNKGNIISGDYKVEVPKIINTLNDNNIFLYVDPFGIKHLRFDIFNMLKGIRINSAELLLNFNAFGFLREGCRLLKISQNDIGKEYEVDGDKSDGPNDIDNMNDIANGNYWIEILNEYHKNHIDMKRAETRFVNEYMEKLRGVFKYVLGVPIRTGEENVPKYSMIFGSNYIDGFLLMADNMLKCDNELKVSNNDNRFSIFDYFEKLNCYEDVLRCITNEFVSIKALCAAIYQNIGVKYSHKEIQDTLKKLECERKIVVKRNPNYTKTGKPAQALTIMNRDYKIEVKLN